MVVQGRTITHLACHCCDSLFKALGKHILFLTLDSLLYVLSSCPRLAYWITIGAGHASQGLYRLSLPIACVSVASLALGFSIEIQNQFGSSIKILRIDNAHEYVFLTSCAHTPQQNDVTKRKSRHLVETIRCLLHYYVPLHFWGDALLIACYLINRMPLSTLNSHVPYSILYPQHDLYFVPLCATNASKRAIVVFVLNFNDILSLLTLLFFRLVRFSPSLFLINRMPLSTLNSHVPYSILYPQHDLCFVPLCATNASKRAIVVFVLNFNDILSLLTLLFFRLVRFSPSLFLMTLQIFYLLFDSYCCFCSTFIDPLASSPAPIAPLPTLLALELPIELRKGIRSSSNPNPLYAYNFDYDCLSLSYIHLVSSLDYVFIHKSIGEAMTNPN
ncbi:hypothetical protein CR513_23682, partial [Mucuna pruriens]